MHGWPMPRSRQVWEVALVLSWPSGSWPRERLMVAGARGEGCQTGRTGGASSRNLPPDAVSSPTSSSRNVQRCPVRGQGNDIAPQRLSPAKPTGSATSSRSDAHRPETLKRSPTGHDCRASAKPRQQIDRAGAAISAPQEAGASAAIASRALVRGEPFGEQLLVARRL